MNDARETMRNKGINKRGELPLYAAMETVLALIIILGLFFGTAYAVGDSGKIIQKRLAKESGLIIDSLYAMPLQSQVEISYPQRNDEYSFEAGDGVVTVGAKLDNFVRDTLSKKQSYTYNANGNYPLLGERFVFTELAFYKDKRAIIMQNKPTAFNTVQPTTSADIDTQRIFITYDATLSSNAAAIIAAVQMESTASQSATETSNDLIIAIKIGQQLHVEYPTLNPETKQQSKKLAEILTQEIGQEIGQGITQGITQGISIITIDETMGASTPTATIFITDPSMNLVPAITRSIRRYYS